jgi:hypothetical protein
VTTSAAGEAGPVEEDAGAVDQPGAQRAHAALVVGVVLLGPGAAADRRELPVLVGEVGDGCGHPGQVVLVGEEGAVAAAAVVRTALDDAGAAAAEDARPGRRQPGQVGADDVVRIGRVGELDPLPGEVQRHLGRDVVHPASVERTLRLLPAPGSRPELARVGEERVPSLVPLGASLWRGPCRLTA